MVDSRATFAFFEALFGKPVLTFDKRWLRCMARGGHNHFHYDNVYVGRGTPNRVTVWTALNDDGTWLGNFHHQGATDKPMSELRKEWGI